MNVLIVYASNSGGAKTAAEIIEEVFADAGNSVVVASAEFAKPEDFKQYDLVILGSCTWNIRTKERTIEGQLQYHFRELQKKLASLEFPGQKFAVYGLGDSTYTNFCAAADKLDAQVKKMKGIVVGRVLKLDHFFFKLDENRKLAREWAREMLKQVEKSPASVSN